MVQQQQQRQPLPHSGPAVKLWGSDKPTAPNDTSAATTELTTPTTTGAGAVTSAGQGGVASSTPQQQEQAAAAASAATASRRSEAPSPKFTTMFAPSAEADAWEKEQPKPYWPTDAKSTAAAAAAAAVEAAAATAAADVVGKAGVDGAVIVLPDETPNEVREELGGEGREWVGGEGCIQTLAQLFQGWNSGIEGREGGGRQEGKKGRGV